MTPPMTPREKVLLALIENKGRTRGDISDAILTALASGSGDHAELARTALQDSHELSRRGLNPDVRLNEAERAAITALLAENAALRADRTFLVDQKEGADDALFDGLTRAAEAERKLAEAVGLLRKVVEEFGGTIDQYHKIGPDWTSADGEMFNVSVVLDREPLIGDVRTFLSKEAA